MKRCEELIQHPPVATGVDLKIVILMLELVIPLRKEAKEIFTEQFKETIPKLTNPEFNRHIKTIGKMAGLNQRIWFSYKKGNKTVEINKPKYNWITSHMARRSFCTNEFLAGNTGKVNYEDKWS